jgi:hypothetical protein
MGWGGYLGFFWCLMLWGFCLLQDMFLNDDFANQIFFFLTYVLGCDGLVWILAPRDIDNV